MRNYFGVWTVYIKTENAHLCFQNDYSVVEKTKLNQKLQVEKYSECIYWVVEGPEEGTQNQATFLGRDVNLSYCHVELVRASQDAKYQKNCLLLL